MSQWRECGSCTACCTVMSVDELDKPDGVACAHECASGCAVYRQRPASCRDFYCWWAGEGSRSLTAKIRRKLHRDALPRLLQEDERPDQLGVLFHIPSDDSPFLRATGLMLFIAREVREGAFEEPRARSTIERLAARRLVCLVRGEKRSLLGPPTLVAQAQAFLLGMVR